MSLCFPRSKLDSESSVSNYDDSGRFWAESGVTKKDCVLRVQDTKSLLGKPFTEVKVEDKERNVMKKYFSAITDEDQALVKSLMSPKSLCSSP